MNVKACYCGMPGLEVRALFPPRGEKDSFLFRWHQFQGRFVVLTFRARVAVVLILRDWNLQPGDEVLMPAYNCGTEVDSVLWYGAKVVFYRVDRQASIDWLDVRRRVTNRTRVLYVTHYFGWPQHLGEIVDFCRKRGIRVLEDCALSLFSFGPEGPLGTMGDASVFSFPKTLAVPDSGALTSREGIMNPPLILEAPPRMEVLRNTLPLVKRAVIRGIESAGIYGLVGSAVTRSWRWHTTQQNGEFPDMPQSYYFDGRMASWGPSGLSLSLLSQCNPQTVADVRRRNYQVTSRALRDIPGIGFLFSELPEGVCPLGFPLLVNNRRKFSAALNDMGVASTTWWEGYHQKLRWDEFPEARFLKDHLLMLPIHQQMTLEHIGYMAECVKTVAHRSRSLLCKT